MPLLMKLTGLASLLWILLSSALALAETSPAALSAVHQERVCKKSDCSDRDAIIFIHGIYGSAETFKNEKTHFDWPAEFPGTIGDRQVDVFLLEYKTLLLSWAKGSLPDFEQIDTAVYAALKPLRTSNYRSIGIIAHSLGGNVASSYIHRVKTARSHPARAQHAFVITLGTPVLGSQVANLASLFKSTLGMSDPLLQSLKIDNLFLRMLSSYRVMEGPKGEAYRCRPVHLHVAFEEERMGPFRIVAEESATAVRNIAVPPIMGFARDHSEIAKPTGPGDDVFLWVSRIVTAEYLRLAIWDQAHSSYPSEHKMCELIPSHPFSE